MRGLFISATGTGIGKTAVAAALGYQLNAANMPVRIIKPVISGFAEGDPDSDTAILLRALGQDPTPEAMAEIAPWRFAAALSPHLAARLEKREIALDSIVDFCRTAVQENRVTLLEGAGGLMSPLTESALNIDLAMALDWPLVLVSGTYLGAVSHLLAALEVAQMRGLTVQGVVLNESELPGMRLEEMVETIRTFADAPVPLYVVPRIHAPAEPWRHFPELTALCHF